MTFKNHIDKHGKTLNKSQKAYFGDLFQLMEDALNLKNPELQQKACKELGQMNLNSQLYKDLSPQLKQAVINQIQATTQFNVDRAEILRETGRGAIAIKKSQASTKLSNSELLNKTRENAADFHYSARLEKQRHELEINYIRLNSMVRQAMGMIDGQARLITASNQPELKQIPETLKYQKEVGKHLLSNGDASRVDLIHKKDYTQVNNPVASFVSKAAEKLGFLL